MKSITLILAFFVIISIFSAAFIMAEDEESELVSEDATEQITLSEENEVAAEVETTETSSEIAVNDTAKDFKIGTIRTSAGYGWVIKSDSSDAVAFRAFWATSSIATVSADKIKELKKTYSDNKTKLYEELAKLVKEDSSLVNKSTGRITIRNEHYKLAKKEFTDTNKIFYVLPESTSSETIKSTSDLSAVSVGTLRIGSTKFPDFTVFNGELELTSGTYSGRWTVSAAGKTKVTTGKSFNIKTAAVSDKTEKIENIKERAEEKNITVRKGFWKRLFG